MKDRQAMEMRKQLHPQLTEATSRQIGQSHNCGPCSEGREEKKADRQCSLADDDIDPRPGLTEKFLVGDLLDHHRDD